MAKNKRGRSPPQQDEGSKTPSKMTGITPSGGAVSDRIAPVIYGLFFATLLLACSPLLDSKFALPKLIVLSAGVLSLCALWFFRVWRVGRISSQAIVLYLALALAAWWTLTTAFAVHVPTALFGEFDYYNGLFTHLGWLALLVVSMSMPFETRTVRQIITLLVASIALVAIVNLAEIAGITSMGLGEVSTLGDRVAASALMNFAIPFVVVGLIRSRHWAVKCVMGALLALLLVSEFISQGRGPWIGLLVAAFILVAGLRSSRFRWQVAVLVAAGIATLAGLASLLSPTVAQRFTSFTHLVEDESISHRFVYYRAAVRAIYDHPIVGIGFENFRNIYPQYRGDDSWFFKNIIPTMVHNGYIESALNNGIPALLLYVVLIGIVLLKLGRDLTTTHDPAKRDLLLCLLAAISAYLVQDLSGWLDLASASVFWIALGLAVNQSSHTFATAQKPVPHALPHAFLGVMVLVSVYMLGNGYARICADANLFRAQSLDASTQWQEIELLINKSLASLPSDSRTEATSAQLVADRFLATRDPAAYARSHELFESSYQHNNFDRMRLVNLISLETKAMEMGVIDRGSDFAAKAVETLSKTDRENPAFHEFTAQFFAVQNQFDKALGAILQALEWAPTNDHYRALEIEYRSRKDAANLQPKR